MCISKKKLVGILLGIVTIVFGYAQTSETLYHDYTGFPMTEDGWTDLVKIYTDPSAYNDSRIIYVSTSGNDSTAIDYSPQDASLGNDPYNPIGPIDSYATLNAAYARLRDGYPDILLLRRGDVWTEDFPNWQKSGRSNSERMILGAYGSLSQERPKTGNYYSAGNITNQIITSIEFASFVRQYANVSDCVLNLLIEDCAFLKGTGSGIVIQGIDGEFSNVVLRRSVISERYPTASTGHTQGLFVAHTKGFLLEENFFDHNGWTANPAEGDEATIFNHNTYFDISNKDTVFRFNWSSRASSQGFQSGGGGSIYANLSFQDPIGINPSRAETYHIGVEYEVLSNVILDPEDSKSGQKTNWGIPLNNTIYGIIKDNIIAGNINPINSLSIGVLPSVRDGVQMDVKNVIIEDNIIHDFGGYIYIAEQYPIIDNITVRNNSIHEPDPLQVFITASPIASLLNSAGNKFHSGSSANESFYYAGESMDLKSWASIVGDTTSVSDETSPSREYSIFAYLDSIGESGDLNSLYSLISRQRKGNWDSRYTALTIINFVRESFGKGPIDYPYTMSNIPVFLSPPKNIRLVQ